MRSLPNLVLDLSQDAVSPDLLILFLFTFAHSSFMGLREETLVIVAFIFWVFVGISYLNWPFNLFILNHLLVKEFIGLAFNFGQNTCFVY